ncbi:MAG: lipid-transfer protein [Chloroflexota bacterium]|nr:lipid-transfer protein [Chloroflexota bacterium]
MQEIAIIGIGQTVWGKFPDRTVKDQGREAMHAALKDANLTWQDIQYIVAGIDPYSGYDWLLSGSTLEASLGYTGIPATSIYNACATGAYTMDLGRALIGSGYCDIVICVGSFKAPGGFFPTTGSPDDPTNLDLQRFRLLGKTNPAFFAFHATRRMHNYGMTESDLAHVKVKNSKHGKLNPYARYQKEYTMDEVLNSPMVSYPLRLYEIAATSDGAAAVILCNAQKARELGSRSVQLAAINAPQPKYPNIDVTLQHFGSQCELSTQSTPAGEERPHECLVARGGLEQANVGPEDLDFAEVYDLATSMELDWIEDIGICNPGEAEKLLREGATAIGGKIPINPSGGVSSFGESIPAQALLQTCELVRQLRGDAGPRQIENAKVGLAINKGLGHSLSCIIAKK